MNLKLLKQPHLTEKSVNQKEELNQVTFLVDKGANKVEIRRAVQELFGVKVLKVNTTVCHGKWRRLQGRWGRRTDWKKAVVSLTKGQKIEVKQ